MTNVNNGSDGGHVNPKTETSGFLGVMSGTYGENGMSFHLKIMSSEKGEHDTWRMDFFVYKEKWTLPEITGLTFFTVSTVASSVEGSSATPTPLSAELVAAVPFSRE